MMVVVVCELLSGQLNVAVGEAGFESRSSDWWFSSQRTERMS